MPRRLLFAVLLAVTGAGAFATGADARQKTDVVFLNNGDRMTGEIKQLDRGILKLSTDDIGTLNIEWEKVDSLSSVYQFRIEDSFGEKYFGAIFMTRDGILEVITGGASRRISQPTVVAITPMETSFWQQLDGSMSLGFSYTKSNQLAQLSTDIYVRRRTLIRMWELDLSSISTAQEDEDTQRREDFSLTYNRLFERALFALAGVGLQTNDELGLDLRALVFAGMGINWVQSNHNDFQSTVGLSANRESSDVAEDTYNLEAFVSAEHSVFRYDYPKTDVTTELTVYPNLSDWGRVRAELDISASREVIRDFTLVLSFYDSYDSDPLDPSGEKNDYGLVFSMGWTF